MSDMPNIFYVSNRDADRNEKNRMKYASEVALTDCTQYTRADIHNAVVAERDRYKAALGVILGCFNAAYAEGLLDVMSNEDNVQVGGLYDLVSRRLLPAMDIAQQALGGDDE